MSSDPQSKPNPLTLRKRLYFSAVVCVAFFALAEIGFRGLELIKPPRHVDFGLGFNDDSRVFIGSSPDAGRLETAAAKRVSFVPQRFSKSKPPATFRIVALGGSSVHYLEPEFRQLERELSFAFQEDLEQVEIINCGGLAYGSGRLVVVFREMLDYEPDLILLYSGHNEFEEVEQLTLSGVQRLSFDRMISNSAIIRFIRDRKTEYEINHLETEHNRRLLASEEPVSEINFARAWSYQFNHEDVQERMENYEHNLRLILNLAKMQQIPVIIGTVASNLLRPYLPQHAAARYEQVYNLWTQGSAKEGLTLAQRILMETPGRHQASQLENNILRKLAEEFSIPLVDVEALVAFQEPHGIPGETLFEDHCHLNRAGCAVWIDGYAPEIERQIRLHLREPGSRPAKDQD